MGALACFCVPPPLAPPHKGEGNRPSLRLSHEFTAGSSVWRRVPVRGEADRLSNAMGQIEARSRMVDDLNQKLSDLSALGSQLDERSRELLTRMAGADERFGSLNARADEAARIEKLVPVAVATVERAERRVGEVDGKVASMESRANNLEGLA